MAKARASAGSANFEISVVTACLAQKLGQAEYRGSSLDAELLADVRRWRDVARLAWSHMHRTPTREKKTRKK